MKMWGQDIWRKGRILFVFGSTTEELSFIQMLGCWGIWVGFVCSREREGIWWVSLSSLFFLLRTRTNSQVTSGQLNDSTHRLEQTRGRIVPGQQGSDHSQTTTNTCDHVTSGQMSQVSRGQEAEGNGQDEEHGRQCHRRSQRCDPEHEREDGPANQEDAQSVVQSVIRRACVTGHDPEARDQDSGVCQPERAVGAVEKCKMAGVKMTRAKEIRSGFLIRVKVIYHHDPMASCNC